MEGERAVHRAELGPCGQVSGVGLETRLQKGSQEGVHGHCCAVVKRMDCGMRSQMVVAGVGSLQDVDHLKRGSAQYQGQTKVEDNRGPPQLRTRSHAGMWAWREAG